jgi:hypothetical protein
VRSDERDRRPLVIQEIRHPSHDAREIHHG